MTRTPTGYWVVKRGNTQLGGGVTRQAAERERWLVEGLRRRCGRRSRDARRTLVRR